MPDATPIDADARPSRHSFHRRPPSSFHDDATTIFTAAHVIFLHFFIDAIITTLHFHHLRRATISDATRRCHADADNIAADDVDDVEVRPSHHADAHASHFPER